MLVFGEPNASDVYWNLKSWVSSVIWRRLSSIIIHRGSGSAGCCYGCNSEAKVMMLMLEPPVEEISCTDEASDNPRCMSRFGDHRTLQPPLGI